MQRVIFLVDMNAFFISCEATRRPELRGRPAAVAGDPKRRSGIILAANYEARAFGVRTTMVIHEALKLCPDLLLIPPDHHFYVQKSDEVMRLLSDYTPVIEQGSIDEAWLDMTGCECLFGKPRECAEQIMDRISRELGLYCSIGISENKFLAKVASDFKKPQGITELWVRDVPEKLWPRNINVLYGVGRKTAEALNRLGIQTVGQLAATDQEYLVRRFGKYAIDLKQKANGLDDSPVTPHVADEMKSIGRSTTLPYDIDSLEEAKRVIMALSEDVGQTARQYNKKGRTVQITLKYNDFKTITRQTTISPTYLSKEIMAAGIGLLKANWNPSRSVRLLGISISGFDEDMAADQISLFDLPPASQPEKGSQSDTPYSSKPAESQYSSAREEKLEKSLDEIRRRFGRDKIKRATLIQKDYDA
jgi:DNA polymerase-4